MGRIMVHLLVNNLYNQSHDVFDTYYISLTRVSLAVLVLVVSSNTPAADWKIEPNVSVAGTYTDNVTLSVEGNETSDFITELVPGIRVSATGSRLDLSLIYNIQGVYYRENSDLNDVFHQLDARANAELFKDLFFLDTNVFRAQRVIDPQQSLPVGNLSITTNITDVTSYRISPYFQKRVTPSLYALVRYGYNKTDLRDTALFDSTDKLVEADIYSIPGSQKLSWGLSYESRKYESDDGFIWEAEKSSLNLGYNITRRFSLTTIGGYEENKYVTSNIIEDGSFWRVGFRWTPGHRTELALNAGRRFYGKTGELNFNHRSRRWRWGVTYTEDFETISSQLTNRQGANVTGEPITLPSDPAVTTGTFLNKGFNFSAQRNSGKTELGISLFDQRREYQISNDNDKTYGGSVSWLWRLARRTELEMQSEVIRLESAGTTQENKDIISTLSLRRHLTRNGTLSFNYRNSRRDSNVADSNYRQNMYTIIYELSL